MYNDYTVTYETNINEFIIPILVGLAILLVLVIIYLVSLAKLFKKANRSGIAAIIPIYNFMVMLEIINKPKWQIILLFVPFVNIIVSVQVMYQLAKSFRKSTAFSILTAFFPFIFIPIIAFSDSEYIGINQEAMLGTSYASDKPVIKEEEMEATRPEEVKETKPLDISIGGGVYQKEYQESLLDVPEENKKVDILAPFKIESESTPIITEEKEKTGVELFKNVEFIETENANLSSPTQVEEPKTITTDDIYNSVPISNINSQTIPEPNDVIAIEPIPTIVGPEQVTNDILIPNRQEEITIENNQNASENITMNSQNIVNTPISNIDDSQYVHCPHCGAVIKKDAPRCFMCGKER